MKFRTFFNHLGQAHTLPPAGAAGIGSAALPMPGPLIDDVILASPALRARRRADRLHEALLIVSLLLCTLVQAVVG